MNNCPAKLSGHLKVWLARAVTEKGTHDSAGIQHEYRLCLDVQKMSQKETTRAITSSSDKLHQTEGEEMNEELLNGSFQLLILQLKPGAVFPPLRYSELLCQGEVVVGGRTRNLLCPLTFGDFCVGHHSPASPLLPAQGPRGSHWSHKRELNLPLVVAPWEAPAVAISQISKSHSGTWGWPQIPVGFLHPPHINQPIPGSSLLFPRESDITHSKGHVSSVGSSCSG